MNKDLKYIAKSTSGLALLYAILLITVIASLLLVIVSLTLLGLNNSKQGERRTKVLDIAEAGINYYLWHLVHDPDDYCDGNTCPGGGGPYGPYVHDFTDNTGTKIGTYTLTITPPGGGSDLVTVESRGDVEDGSENRTIVAKLGIPTFAQYAVVANVTSGHLRFGTGTEVFGPIHNNGGIRFDGLAHGLVTSAVAQHDDPDFDDCTAQDDFGVHTCVSPSDPSPPAPVPSRPDVFEGGRQFPVPSIDFNQVTADLNDIKTEAQDDGYYYDDSGASGYHIILDTDDTFDIYRVNSTTGSCWTGWYLGWQPENSINSQTLLYSNVPFPNNGIIFVEDDLWIDGKIDGASITVAAAMLPESTDRSIFINSDLEYTNYDGTDKIGLIAQNNISVGLYSEGSFTGTNDEQELLIHAALLAQKGRVGRNYYPWWCSSTYYKRNIITVYGSIATNKRYGFSWGCPSWCSGYDIRNLIYDQNLSTGPPPSWPTIGNYAILDFREK